MKNGAGRQAVSLEGLKTMILTKRQSKGLCRRRHEWEKNLPQAVSSRSERFPVENHYQYRAIDSFSRKGVLNCPIRRQVCPRVSLGCLWSYSRFNKRLFINPKEISMAALKGSKTEENLKAAFAGESQANRRYLYFANKADVEGQPDVAALFRSTAEGETGHAHGHLEWLEQCGDPATGMPFGATRQNLASAVAGETHEYTDMYPGMAKTARSEGHDEVADWFETLAKAERSHANRYAKALTELVD
jgi:rubrerythrin